MPGGGGLPHDPYLDAKAEFEPHWPVDEQGAAALGAVAAEGGLDDEDEYYDDEEDEEKDQLNGFIGSLGGPGRIAE